MNTRIRMAAPVLLLVAAAFPGRAGIRSPLGRDRGPRRRRQQRSRPKVEVIAITREVDGKLPREWPAWRPDGAFIIPKQQKALEAVSAADEPGWVPDKNILWFRVLARCTPSDTGRIAGFSLTDATGKSGVPTSARSIGIVEPLGSGLMAFSFQVQDDVRPKKPGCSSTCARAFDSRTSQSRSARSRCARRGRLPWPRPQSPPAAGGSYGGGPGRAQTPRGLLRP